MTIYIFIFYYVCTYQPMSVVCYIILIYVSALLFICASTDVYLDCMMMGAPKYLQYPPGPGLVAAWVCVGLGRGPGSPLGLGAPRAPQTRPCRGLGARSGLPAPRDRAPSGPGDPEAGPGRALARILRPRGALWPRVRRASGPWLSPARPAPPPARHG